MREVAQQYVVRDMWGSVPSRQSKERSAFDPVDALVGSEACVMDGMWDVMGWVRLTFYRSNAVVKWARERMTIVPETPACGYNKSHQRKR